MNGCRCPSCAELPPDEALQAAVDAELDVIGELHELVTSWRLSPWQAAFALFNPIGEEAPDVA